MPDQDDRKGQQPEALATFAAAARKAGAKPDEVGLTATPETSPLPADSARKDQGATLRLREGTFGDKEGAEEVIDSLPDRTRDS